MKVLKPLFLIFSFNLFLFFLTYSYCQGSVCSMLPSLPWFTADSGDAAVNMLSGPTSGAAACVTLESFTIVIAHLPNASVHVVLCAAAAIFPVTFCSATPSGVGSGSSVWLPESCVWMHVKHKKQT